MRVFSDMDMCEQLGSGMKKILKSYPESIFEISEHFISTKFAFSEEALKVLGEQTIDEPNSTKNVGVNVRVNVGVKLNKTQQAIFDLIKNDQSVTAEIISAQLAKTTRTIERALAELKAKGFIERVGSDKKGFWKILK